MARDWSEFEVEAVVADYFAMLLKQLRGEEYSKTAHRRALMKLLDDRSDGSVEFKHQNISAVLLDIGISPNRGVQAQVELSAVAGRCGQGSHCQRPRDRADGSRDCGGGSRAGRCRRHALTTRTASGAICC